VSRNTPAAAEPWVSCHLYYHEDLNHLALEFLFPLVTAHLREPSIDTFFFVRYGLGGPHLRLRLRALPGLRDRVVEMTRQAAAEFLSRDPSRKPRPEAAIQGTNEALLSSDAHETDDSVYPDNSFVFNTFRPEVQRYGGPDLLGESLELFAFSSAVALDFLRQHGSRPRATQLAAMVRVLLQQAMGLARDENELLRLVGYASASWSEHYPGAMEKGGEVFQAQRDVFLGLVRREIERALSDLGGDGATISHPTLLLGRASRRLSWAIGRAEEPVRSSICVSQLHMTANRLGLSNPEEVYLGRLLSAALEEIVGDEGEARKRLRDLLGSAAARELLPAMHVLTAGW
jgi:thiopeptide-type bacteriocin biosynthesis protein